MYCIYLRKSRKDIEAENRGEGETLARHEKILLALAKTHQYNIGRIYKEIVSGDSIAARPVMQELLSDVEQGIWEGVLVTEVERLARGNTIDQGIVQQTFQYSSTKIITPIKTYDPENEFDQEYFEFGLFMSRREYNTIKRRLQQGRYQSVKEGKFIGSVPPYGYQRQKLMHDKGYTLVPNTQEAKTVITIFEKYLSGENTTTIANYLNSLGIRTRKDKYWRTTHVLSVLRNPVYCGEIWHNYRKPITKMADGQKTVSRPRSAPDDVEIYKGLHEPLITKEMFTKANERLSLNLSRPSPKKVEIKNPLSGIVKCGYCSYNMVRRPNNKGYEPVIMCSHPNCENHSSPISLIEEKTLNFLREYIGNYEIQVEKNKKAAAKTGKMLKDRVSELIKEKDKLISQQSKIYDFFETGIYSENIFISRQKEISSKISDIENALIKTQAELDEHTKSEDNNAMLIPKIKNILEVYNTLETASAKNKLLCEVIDRIEYKKPYNSRFKKYKEEFELTIYLRLHN